MKDESAMEPMTPSKLFDDLASMGGASLQRYTASIRAPKNSKVLRKFTPTEAANWLSITPAYLRQLHSKSVIQEVEKLPNNQRTYSADEIHQIRRTLYDVISASEKPGSAVKYRAGKPDGADPCVISVSNFKGGVSKTTSAVHLAVHEAMLGNRVLILDADSQASISHLMDVVPQPTTEDQEGDATIYDAIRVEDPVHPSQAIYETYFTGIHICPASLDLEEFEFEIPGAMMSGALADKTPFYERVFEVIDAVKDNYDVVIIDCPPRLSFLTIAAISAATICVVPLPPSMLDVISTNKFLQMAAAHIETVTSQGGSMDVRDVRLLLTKVKSADINHTEVSAFIRKTYGAAVLQAEFLESTAISDVTKTSETLFEAPRSDFNRQTYDRAMTSVKAMANEIHDLIEQSWRA